MTGWSRTRELGYDVVHVDELGTGIKDPQVLALARAEEPILMTLDNDFGRLIVVEGFGALRYCPAR